MNFDVDKLFAEFRKSAPIFFFVFLGAAAFGFAIERDFLIGMKQAFAPWIRYTLLVGCPIGAVVSLIVWLYQSIRTWLKGWEEKRYYYKKEKSRLAQVMDHIHNLDRGQLAILLAMVRSKNGRAVKLHYSNALNQMEGYEIFEKERTIYQTGNNLEMIVLNDHLLKKRKSVDRLVCRLLSDQGVVFDDNGHLKRYAENIDERLSYSDPFAYKLVRFPTLFEKKSFFERFKATN